MAKARMWCAVPTIRTGDTCERNANWYATVSVEDWKRAFPHDTEVVSESSRVVPGIGEYVCGNHKRTLITKGTATEPQFTHVHGPEGLIRR